MIKVAMRKACIFLLFAAILLVSSCGNSSDVNEAVDNSEDNSSDVEVLAEEEIENGIELAWETGSAKLTRYRIQKSTVVDNEGQNILILYYDFSNPSDEPQSMMNNLYVDVFQNGVQIDQNQFINTKEGQDAFKDIQKGTILTCAFEYELPDTENTLTIHMSAFDNDEEVTAEQELVLK